MYLISSNENKIKEFLEYGLKFTGIKSLDLPEVQGNRKDVILHKSLLAGEDTLVEDTIIEINGEEIVDIKFKLDEYKKDFTNVVWYVTFGYNDGSDIYITQGEIEGRLRYIEDESLIPDEAKNFGFEYYFIPKGSNKCLYELMLENKKHLFSARHIAVQNLLDLNFVEKVKIEDIPQWKGQYQKY